MSESELVEDLIQEEFDAQMKDGQLAEELQILQEFYTEILLLCFINHYIEVSLDDSASLGLEEALVDRELQMSDSKLVENLVQEEFGAQMKEGEFVEELQVLEEFYTEILLLCFIDHYIEMSLEDSASLGIEEALADREPQMSKSELMEDLVQEEFDAQIKKGELAEELQVLQGFYTEILLLCFINHYIEVSLQDSTSLGTEGALVDREPQIGESKLVEDLVQEEFDAQMKEGELAEELQVLEEFYTEILLLCFIDHYIEASVEDSTSLGIEGASMGTPPQMMEREILEDLHKVLHTRTREGEIQEELQFLQDLYSEILFLCFIDHRIEMCLEDSTPLRLAGASADTPHQVEKAPTPQKIKDEPSSSWSTVKPQHKQSWYTLEIEEWTVEPESTAEVQFSAESFSITQSERIMPTRSPRFIQRKDVINRIRILKMLALVGGITVGYAFNVSGGIFSIPIFLKRFPKVRRKINMAKRTNFCTYADFKSLMISSIIPLGASISVLPAHALSNRWERKPVLRIGLILLSVGSGLFAWLPLAFLGIVGLIMSGLGSGIINQVIPIICSELAPEEIQENLRLLYGYQSLGGFIVLGIYLIASYSPKWVWRVPFGILCFLAVVLLVISFFIDESPRCLIQQDKVQAARDVFTKYRDLRKTIVDVEFAELEKAIEDEKKRSVVKDLLSPQNRPTLIIKAVAELVPQLLGASSLMFFGPLASTSVSSNSHIIFITSAGAGLWGFLMTLFLSFFLLKRCGRRRLAIGSSFLTLLSQISLWVVLHFFANSHSNFTKPVAYTMIGAIVLNYAGFSMLTNPYGWIKSSIEGRGVALADAWLKSLGSFMMVIMNVALIHMFCTIEAFVYVFTGFVAAFTTSFVYFLVPEASQIGTYNMKRLIWMRHWFWKKFVKEEDSKFIQEEGSREQRV